MGLVQSQDPNMRSHKCLTLGKRLRLGTIQFTRHKDINFNHLPMRRILLRAMRSSVRLGQMEARGILLSCIAQPQNQSPLMWNILCKSDWTPPKNITITGFQSGLELVSVNGVNFHRIRWVGTDRESLVPMRGFVYVTIHENEVIYLSSQDRLEYQADLNRANAAAMSFTH